jgi:hypothetical protein
VFTRDIGLLGKIFVDYVLIVIAFLGALIVVKGFIKPERLRFFESIVERNNILAGLLILALYLFFMPRIGFLPSSYIFFLVLSLYLTDDRLALKTHRASGDSERDRRHRFLPCLQTFARGTAAQRRLVRIVCCPTAQTKTCPFFDCLFLDLPKIPLLKDPCSE